MNRLQFLKRLLATLFGAAIVKPSRSMPEGLEPTVGSSRPEDVTGEDGHLDPSSTSGSASHTEPVEVYYLLSATVAGTPYYDFPHIGPQLLVVEEPEEPSIGVLIPPSLPSFKEFPATLKLEPDNEFDYRAVEVFWGAHKMGYIPRRHNKVLYNLMKDGAELKANIRLVIPSLVEESIITNHDFHCAYDLRIRVYLLSENA